MSEDFVGAGWAFPLDTDKTGSIRLVDRERELEDSIRIILGTAPGERPMRPEFGCGIHDFVYAPASAETAGRIGYEVRAALARWEPRIEVNDVIVSIDLDDRALMYINILYSLAASNDPRNLVFPFYVIPAESPPVAAEGAR